jgi:hypothetical protein
MASRNGVILVFSLTRNTNVAKNLPTMYGELFYRNTQIYQFLLKTSLIFWEESSKCAEENIEGSETELLYAVDGSSVSYLVTLASNFCLGGWLN